MITVFGVGENQESSYPRADAGLPSPLGSRSRRGDRGVGGEGFGFQDKSRKFQRFALTIAALAISIIAGCTRISVDPDCPANLEVGDIIDLSANAVDEGGIPTFAWTVIPAAAGEFDNPDRQDTDFTARQAGPATIRLFASDGLFTSTAECQVQIGAGGLIVELTFSPDEPRTGDDVTLTCKSLGGLPAEEFTIEQDEGPAEVALTPGAEGEAVFTPTAAGTYTFSCTGTSGDETSEPSTVSITVRSTRTPR